MKWSASTGNGIMSYVLVPLGPPYYIPQKEIPRTKSGGCFEICCYLYANKKQRANVLKFSTFINKNHHFLESSFWIFCVNLLKLHFDGKFEVSRREQMSASILFSIIKFEIPYLELPFSMVSFAISSKQSNMPQRRSGLCFGLFLWFPRRYVVQFCTKKKFRYFGCIIFISAHRRRIQMRSLYCFPPEDDMEGRSDLEEVSHFRIVIVYPPQMIMMMMFANALIGQHSEKLTLD